MSVVSMQGFVLLVPALATAVACGGSNQPSNNPQQCPPGYSFDGRGCVALAAPPPATPVPGPDAGAAPDGAAAPSKNAKALDPAAAGVATQLIEPAAKAAAPAGAKPMNIALAGEFAQGQSLETVIQLEAGKCYTVVGAGAPPIQNVDVQLLLVSPLPGVAPVVAQDQSSMPIGVVGEKPNCFKALFPGPVKVVLTVSAGQGIAAAEAYVK
jgi:hypothetical protein